MCVWACECEWVCVCVRERESVCGRMCGLCKTQFVYRKKRCTEVFVRTLYVNYLSFSNDIQWVISIFGVSVLHTSLLNCFNWRSRNRWSILNFFPYTVNFGYNDLGYNEFMAISNKICKIIWSQMVTWLHKPSRI